MKNYIYLYYIDCLSRLSEFVVSAQSLKNTNPKYPIYCMIGNSISWCLGVCEFIKEITGQEPLYNYQPLSEIIYNNEKIVSVFCCSGKLKIFNLTNFDKIVLIDTDTYITQNIDEIFDYPSGSMSDHQIDNTPNAGVLVVEPNVDCYNQFLKAKDNGYKQGYFGYSYDQDFVCKYFDYYNHPELRLPYIYNTIVPNIAGSNVDITKTKIFHFGCFPFKCEDVEGWDIKNHCKTELVWNTVQMYLKNYMTIINYYRVLYPNIPLALPKYKCL